ncbi:MAG: hypothetical protein ACLSAH_14230 [Bilophila wadsworthia]
MKIENRTEYITMLAVCNGWFAHAIMPSVSNPVPFMMQRAVALLPVVRHGFPCIFSALEKTLLKFRSRHILSPSICVV